MAVPETEEPPAKKNKIEDGSAQPTEEVKEKKEKKEGKEGKEKKEKKEGKEGKEGKEKKDKDKKDKKDKKEKEGKEGKEKKEKKDKSEKKEKKEKTAKEGKEPKDKKDKKEKKEKKDKKDKKAKKLKLGGKAKLKAKLGKFTKAKAKKAGAPSGAAPPKVLLKSEDDYEPVNRWWERADGAESGKRGAKKWDSFEHHGLLFAPEYVPHNKPLIYDGKKEQLSPEAEEIAYYWTSVKGTPYEEKDIFIKNFWKTFQDVLGKETVIKDMSKCDFTLMSAFREEERERRLNRSKEEKEEEKQRNAKDTEWYSFAIVDGIREKLGNFRLEPPQLFRGRGEHPKQGLLKKRTFPESCTMNIAEMACIPKVFGMPGHAWRDVVHENSVQWIASFEDGLLAEMKYVSFAATSGLKGQPDMLKYDRARRLVAMVDKIRSSYEKLQASKSLVERQKGTAVYFIDRLALRVGGEKDTEEEADTVGCCSLRVEHITYTPPNTIHFDFLGKDSIQYKNSVEVTQQVYENIIGFMKNKKPEDQIFDKVFPTDLNEYFKQFMDDLSAKVFRTYNASSTLQTELNKFDMTKKGVSENFMLEFYNEANRQVAILCNHQKAESKTHAVGMEKMREVANTIEKQAKALKKHMIALQEGKPPKNPDAKMPKDAAGCKKKLAETKVRLEKQRTSINIKEQNKTVSLGTSKVNYMDPRISVAWCKKVDMPIEKIFPRTVRTKFPWAMHFKSSYVFG